MGPRLLMTTHQLDSLPKYEAWSYTWGAPHEVFDSASFEERLAILVNGRQYLILRNLMDSLSSILWRWDFDDGVQHLWIDAVCINQDNIDERAAQVEIMDQVYRKASSTAVWLGKSIPQSDKAKQMFKAICQIPAEELAPYYQEFPNGSPPPDELWYAYGLPSFGDEDGWKPLLDFFRYQWFSRTWIIQEVTLSTDNVYMFWGDHAMNWTAFGHVAFAGQVAQISRLNNFTGLSYHLSGEMDNLDEIKDWVVADPLVNSFHLWYNRHRYLQRSQTPDEDTMLSEMEALTGCKVATAQTWLMYFCLTNRWADATDPRDKVFAHLGLVNNLAKQDGLPLAAMQANYSADVTAALVYQQLMSLVIEETDSLAVLMALNDPPSLRQADLPSWIPDLSRRHGLDLMWAIRPQFNASKMDQDWNKSKHKMRIDGSYLHVKCTEIGTVTMLSSTLPDFTGPNWHRWAEDLLKLDHIYSCTGESCVEAFWRTILMDSVARKHPAQWPGNEDGDMFYAYVLQSIARYFPGSDSDIKAQEVYLHQLGNVNALSKWDNTDRLPSFIGLRDLTSQITGISEDNLESLSEEAIVAALGQCVDKASKFLVGMDGSMVNRRILISSGGHFVNGPMWAEVSDRIVIIEGCPCPVLLRKSADEPTCFTLIGSVYVHGAMHGQLIHEETMWQDLCIR